MSRADRPVWAYVRVSDEGCWLWVGTVDRDGYGIFGGRRAHRVVLAERLGRPLRAGEVARHTCDNPRCCNPLHLLPGTQVENVRDRVERGRSAAGRSNGRNVLSESDVVAIYRSLGSLAAVASQWNVSKWTVRDIKTGRLWGWLTGQRPRRIPTEAQKNSHGCSHGAVDGV